MGMLLVIVSQRKGVGLKLLIASIGALNLELIAITLESIVTELPRKIFWSQVEHIGYATAPTLLLLFALRYTSQNSKLSLLKRIAIWIIPGIHLALVWTYPLHSWIWTGFVYDGPATNYMAYLHGPWYWFYLGYTILILLLVNLIFLRAGLKAKGFERKQYRMLILGNLVPLLFGFIHGIGWVPIPNLNLFPMGSLVACLVVWLAIRHYQFMDPDPIARLKLVSNLPDGVVVLNPFGLVVSVNPAAQRIIQEEFIPGEPPPQILQKLIRAREDEVVQLDQEDGKVVYLSTYFEVLNNHHGKPIGSLLLFRDISQLIQAEMELRQIERQEAASTERHRIAMVLHDSITQSLHGLSLLSDNLKMELGLDGSQQRAEKLLMLIEEAAHQALREMRLVIYQLDRQEERVSFIEHLLTRLSSVEAKAGLKVDLKTDPDLQVCSEWDEDLSAILDEALNNIIKHAYADSVLIRAMQDGEESLELSIQDDGVGFEVKNIAFWGMGLQNMRERANRLKAELAVHSGTGEGTLIRITIPGKERIS
jgi:signal transduction histidine kinase